jgi:hypothetical protein
MSHPHSKKMAFVEVVVCTLLKLIYETCSHPPKEETSVIAYMCLKIIAFKATMQYIEQLETTRN